MIWTCTGELSTWSGVWDAARSISTGFEVGIFNFIVIVACCVSWSEKSSARSYFFDYGPKGFRRPRKIRVPSHFCEEGFKYFGSHFYSNGPVRNRHKQFKHLICHICRASPRASSKGTNKTAKKQLEVYNQYNHRSIWYECCNKNGFFLMQLQMPFWGLSVSFLSMSLCHGVHRRGSAICCQRRTPKFWGKCLKKRWDPVMAQVFFPSSFADCLHWVQS